MSLPQAAGCKPLLDVFTLPHVHSLRFEPPFLARSKAIVDMEFSGSWLKSNTKR